MKNTAKRIMSAFLVLTMLFSLGGVASAAGSVNLTAGESETVRTSYSGDNYEWSSTDSSVASVSGDGSSAVIFAEGAGSANVTVTVTREVAAEPAEGEADDAENPSSGSGATTTETVGTETWTVTVSAPAKPVHEEPPREKMTVSIDPANGLVLVMNEGSETVSASVNNAVGNVSYSWNSGNPNIAVVSGSGSTVSIKPVSEGHTSISVTAADDSSDVTESITVTVAPPKITKVMASASGSTTVSMDAGETMDLNASVSGGSGSFDFVWDCSGILEFTDRMRANATIKANDAGTGTVTLCVYDADDYSNSSTVTWNVTVKSKSAPLSVSVDPATISLNVGDSGTLSASASGGSGNSGNYEYAWSTDNAIISLSSNGSAATVTGGSAGTAGVTVTVTDRSTGTSNKANCTVTVKSRDASYNASGTATVGSNSSITDAASSIASGYQSSFKVALNSSASVRLMTPSSTIGQLYLSDGSMVAANTSYTYSQFSSMYLRATASGSFSTAYSINDGGNVLSGTLALSASGGIPVSSVSISKTSLSMDTYSSCFLNVGILPSNAAYTINWKSSNSKIASVDGNGASVTVRTRGSLGSATITATVQSLSGGSPVERSCTVRVSTSSDSDHSSGYSFSPSLTLTLGSDYYGTNLADSFRDRFRTAYGYSLPDDATIQFSSAGNTNVAITRLSDGTPIRSKVNYNFAQYLAMSVSPISAGTTSTNYTLTHNNNIVNGTITIYVRNANVSASISPANMTLAPNSSQYVSVSISPSSSYYTVNWSSSNTNIATVSGNGTSATVYCGNRTGNATIMATIQDRNGVRVDRSCVVTVRNQADNTYSPSLALTLGVNYTGTTLSSLLASQFRSVHNMTLNNDAARIRFHSLGNSAVAVTRLANGSLISANTDYTFTQYIGMYAEPLSAGSFNVPYTLTYNGRSLTGTVMVSVAAASISSSLQLSGLNPYTFRDAAANGSAGSTQLSTAITNAVGYSWNYIRFDNASGFAGTLYRDTSRSPVSNTNITSAMFSNLYFVPSQIGNYSIGFTVYNANGGNLAKGTLMISVTAPGSKEVSFSDVKSNDWFSTSVTWAVNRSITNGTGVGTFSPYNTCTTAEILTFLWRSKGSPAPTISNPFTNVNSGDFYYNAALWAYQNGLVTGTWFNGAEPCTRASTVIFLWRLAGSPEAMSSGFSDVTAGTETAAAVNWAVSKGITNGTSPTTFEPLTTCNRGQIVTFLYRAYA